MLFVREFGALAHLRLTLNTTHSHFFFDSNDLCFLLLTTVKASPRNYKYSTHTLSSVTQVMLVFTHTQYILILKVTYITGSKYFPALAFLRHLLPSCVLSLVSVSVGFLCAPVTLHHHHCEPWKHIKHTQTHSQHQQHKTRNTGMDKKKERQ